MAENGFWARFLARFEQDGGRRLVLPLIVAVAMAAALALTLVWLNIERTKLAYRIRTLQQEVERSLDMNAKLSVEREHLLSPHALGRQAEEFGLGPARPGQIRRMSGNEDLDLPDFED